MTQVDELRAKLDEMIKRDSIALCCNNCDGGGYDYDNTKDCSTCNGTGLTEWQNEYLIDQLEALIQQKQLEARLDELAYALHFTGHMSREDAHKALQDRYNEYSTTPKKEETL